MNYQGFGGEICSEGEVLGWVNYADKTPYQGGKRIHVGERLNVLHAPWKGYNHTAAIQAFALTVLLPGKSTEERFYFEPGKAPTHNGKDIAATNSFHDLGAGVWYRYQSGMLTVITPNHQYGMIFHSDDYGTVEMIPMVMPHLNGGFPGGVLASTFEGRPFDKNLSNPAWTMGSTCSNKTIPGQYSDYVVKDGAWGNNYKDNRYTKNSPTPLRRKRDNWYPFIPAQVNLTWEHPADYPPPQQG